MRELSVTLDDHVAAAAADSAERQGISLSEWLNEAAKRALDEEELLLEVAGWEDEGGAIVD